MRQHAVSGRILGRGKRDVNDEETTYTTTDGASGQDLQQKIEQLEETKIFQKFTVEVPGAERLGEENCKQSYCSDNAKNRSTRNMTPHRKKNSE